MLHDESEIVRNCRFPEEMDSPKHLENLDATRNESSVGKHGELLGPDGNPIMGMTHPYFAHI